MIETIISALVMFFAVAVSIAGANEAYRRYQENRLQFDGVGIFIIIGGGIMLALTIADGMALLAIAWVFLIGLEFVKVGLWWMQENEVETVK